MAAKKRAAKKKAAKKKVATVFTPETLGNEAKALLGNEVFRLALDYVESRALIECRTAATPEDSWRGTLKSQAVQDIRATLHAYIAQGEASADKAARQREELRKEQEQETLYKSYLTAAQAAREEADSRPSHLNGATSEGTT